MRIPIPITLRAQANHPQPAPPYSGPPPESTTNTSPTPPLPTPTTSPTPSIPQAEILNDLQRIKAIRQRHRQLQAQETALPVNVRQITNDAFSNIATLGGILITYACFVSVKIQQWLRRAFYSLAIFFAATFIRRTPIGIVLLVVLATMFCYARLSGFFFQTTYEVTVSNWALALAFSVRKRGISFSVDFSERYNRIR